MERHAAEQILCDAMHADESVRSKAEAGIKTLLQTDFAGFLATFGQIMLDSTLPLKIRHISSIIVKNTFHSKNLRIQRGFEKNWLSISEPFRNGFMASLLSNLNIPETQILINLARILGSIIRIECAHSRNEQHFKKMREMVADMGYAVGVMKAISIACDQLYDETEYDFTNDQMDILAAATCHMGNLELPTVFQETTLECIFSSLDTYGPVFRNKDIKNDFLSRLTKYTTKSEGIADRALEVLNRFVSICHEELGTELPAMCQFYNTFLDKGDEAIHLQVFDFWKMIASLNYVFLLEQNFMFLLPRLLSFLKKEEPEDTEMTEHKAACTLLSIFVEQFGATVIKNPISRSFIAEKLGSTDLEARAVGAIALGSLCEAGSADFLSQTLGVLLNDLGNEETVNESLFALAKICEKNLACTANRLPEIIEKCGIIISNSSGASANAAWVYSSLFAAVRLEKLPEAESALYFRFTDILSLLVNKLNALRPADYNLRNALNCALSELISCCPEKLSGVLVNLNSYLFKKIGETLSLIPGSTRESIFVIEDILSNYIVALAVSLEMTPQIDKVATRSLFVAVLDSAENKSHGEVYIAISSLVAKVSDELKMIIPYIIRDVESQDQFIAKSALNCLSDCATYLEKRFDAHISIVIPALVGTIASTNTPLDFKPSVIETFGHVALAIGRKFEPFLEMAVVLFEQINSLNRAGDEDYVDRLRKAVVQFFSCIIVSIGCTNELRNKLDAVMVLLEKAVAEDIDHSYTTESIDLLCDIMSTFNIKFINKGWVGSYLSAAGSMTSSRRCIDKASSMYQELRSLH